MWSVFRIQKVHLGDWWSYSISNNTHIKKAGLDIKDCHGQAIWSKLCVKKLCTCTFCRHNLNLVIVSAFKFPVIRNVLDKVQEVAQMFIKDSKKNMKLLEEVVKQNPRYSSQKVVFNVCITRWVENLDGYNHFLLTYPYIEEVLEEVFELA